MRLMASRGFHFGSIKMLEEEERERRKEEMRRGEMREREEGGSEGERRKEGGGGGGGRGGGGGGTHELITSLCHPILAAVRGGKKVFILTNVLPPAKYTHVHQAFITKAYNVHMRLVHVHVYACYMYEGIMDPHIPGMNAL